MQTARWLLVMEGVHSCILLAVEWYGALHTQKCVRLSRILSSLPEASPTTSYIVVIIISCQATSY